MAEKRMFAKSIVLSDAFLDMPMSARCLYFTLNMFADDDGFVGSPKGIMRHCGASEDDLRILLAKRFVLSFESGVIVIKHWRINNFLRKDRHVDTTYQEELATLALDEKGAYTELVNQRSTNGQPSIDKYSIDKSSIEEISIDKSSVGGDVPPPPTAGSVKSENPVLESIRDAWNSIDHVEKIRDIVPCTARYTETMICVDMYGLSDVLAAITKVRNSKYLKKRGHTKFDSFINRNSISKLLEGSYDVDYEDERNKKTKFQNFEQRDYEDDLEERLINR